MDNETMKLTCDGIRAKLARGETLTASEQKTLTNYTEAMMTDQERGDALGISRSNVGRYKKLDGWPHTLPEQKVWLQEFQAKKTRGRKSKGENESYMDLDMWKCEHEEIKVKLARLEFAEKERTLIPSWMVGVAAAHTSGTIIACMKKIIANAPRRLTPEDAEHSRGILEEEFEDMMRAVATMADEMHRKIAATKETQ